MRSRLLFITLFSVLILSACGGSAAPDEPEGMSVEEQVAATSSAMQTATAVIEKAVSDALTEAAPPPSDTPLPETDTPVPSDTPEATETPTEVVDTGGGSGSGGGDAPASWQVSSGDCRNETGNIKFHNNTGSPATINLVLLKSGRSCAYTIYLIQGPSSFWVEPAKYDITITMCGGTNVVNFTNPLNSNWYFTLKQTFC